MNKINIIFIKHEYIPRCKNVIMVLKCIKVPPSIYSKMMIKI